jgi:hypothetical protein
MSTRSLGNFRVVVLAVAVVALVLAGVAGRVTKGVAK